MTSTEEQQHSGGLMGQLGDAARGYAKARVSDGVKRAAARLGDVTENMNDKADNGGFTAPAVSTALKKVSEGDNPVKAAASGVGTGIKEKVKSAFGRSGRSQKFMNIIEDVTVGVPVDVAYNQWTQFQEFASFMKGVDSVDQTDEVETSWKVKVFKSRRTWKGTVQEQIPDRKIAWSTDGPKGTTKGVVTFHPLADDLTQILLVMEYYPQGFFEKTGNLWRAPGRRARLDLKNVRRFITMRGEETGSWRGEIRDSEVVAQPGEAEGREGRGEDEARAEGQEDQEDQEQYEEEPEEEGDEETAPAGNGRPPRGRQPAGAAQEQDEDEEDEEDEAYQDEDSEDQDYADEDEDYEDEEEGAEEDEGEGYEDEGYEDEGSEDEGSEDEGYEEEEAEEEPEERPRTRRREPARAGRR